MVKLSDSSVELDKLLCEDNATARAVRKAFSRMTLWKWRSAQRIPYASHASKLEKLSRGRVKANGWDVSP